MAAASRDEVLKVCREVIAPLVATDGGQVFLVSLDGETLCLHLAGTCAGCPGSNLTSRSIIEPAIRAVAPSLRVFVSAGIRIPEGARPISPG